MQPRLSVRGQNAATPCNSQDFKLRMPIKCRSGDNNALKGHNYNFIKL